MSKVQSGSFLSTVLSKKKISSFIITPLIACNAFAMCADVLPSLVFIGIGGYISNTLLLVLIITWLLLYLSGGKSKSRVDVEIDYYTKKAEHLLPPKHDNKTHINKYIRFWVVFNEFRVKLYNRLLRGEKNIQDAAMVIIRSLKLSKKYGIYAQHEVKEVKQLLYKFISSIKTRKPDEDESLAITHLDNLILKESDYNKSEFIENFFPNFNVPTKVVAELFGVREKYLIGNKGILIFISWFAWANVVINALTMFGSAIGITKTISIIIGLDLHLFNPNFIAVTFFLAGGCASFKLTRPMIENFGRSFELLLQDFSFVMREFSFVTVFSSLMAFFTAIGSATFAVYNTPIIRMLPPNMLPLTLFIKLVTFTIVFVSAFSLYFISVSSKLTDLFQSHSGLNINYKLIITVALVLTSLTLLDIYYIPTEFNGLLEVSSLLLFSGIYSKKDGVLLVLSLLASFAYTSTCFHQFSLVFHPQGLSYIFAAIEVAFQFTTFALTFYYGLNKFFPSQGLTSIAENYLQKRNSTDLPDVKSDDLKINVGNVEKFSSSNDEEPLMPKLPKGSPNSVADDLSCFESKV